MEFFVLTSVPPGGPASKLWLKCNSVVSLELTEVEKDSGIAEGRVTFETGNKVLLHSIVGEPEILQTSGE